MAVSCGSSGSATSWSTPSGRGLLEPSLASLDGRFYLTIRAEDGRGYVSASDDGLRWEPQRAWCWDDGEPLAMSTTQQHWLPHAGRLSLVYTRKAEENVNVMRWRAPLYMAEVDRDDLAADPGLGAGRPAADRRRDRRPDPCGGMGNFHTVAATPDESWVTVEHNGN